MNLMNVPGYPRPGDEGKPILEMRLSVDRMKYTIRQQLQAYTEQTQEEMDAIVENALVTFDFQGQINKKVTEVITSEIRRFFDFGEGGEMIGEVVREGLKSYFNRKEE